MYNRVLTIEDLVAFCEQQNFSHFSAAQTGYQICVQVPAHFSKTDESDSDMLFASVLAFHTGPNRNRSSVTESAAKKAIKELAYKPVLANFCEIDGVRDFTGHDFMIDDDGNFIYQEKQIGCFTADKPYMKQDPDHDDRMNVFAKVAIPRQYTDAADIIERKGGTACSVELAVNELSWDSNERTLLLNDVVVMGLTLLGKDPDTGNDVQPGMENAHVQIEDFSVENNSITFNSNIIDEIADAVVNRIGNLNNQRKEEPIVDFEEKIEETTVEEMEVESTEETVTEEMSEDASDEVFGEVSEEESEKTEEMSEDVEEVAEETDKETPEVVEESINEEVVEENFDEEPGGESEESSEDELVGDDGVLNNGQHLRHSLSINGMNFEVSLSEIQYAISELVNNTYSESDNDFYSVEVYEGSKNVVMIGWCTGRAYKQGYKVRNSVYSLVGDRVSVKPVFVTADEEAELDRMRSNYSVIESKLAKYEEEPTKLEILNSADYLNIADQANFAELKKQENHFDLTIDEVKSQADAMLLAYAKSGKLNFSAVEQPEHKEESKNDFFAFARVEHNTSFLDGLLRNKK